MSTEDKKDKQMYFSFWNEVPRQNLTEKDRALSEQTRDMKNTEVHELLMNEIQHLKKDNEMLKKENDRQRKRIDRYLAEEEHSYDDQVTLNMRVEKLEESLHGILDKRTWLGKLLFRR